MSKLMSRQEKLLSDWAVTAEGKKALSDGRVSYDELPGTLVAALQRIKDQETLWSDVERYLGDLAMKMRYGSKVANDLPYCVLTVTENQIKFRLTDARGNTRSGAEPIKRYPVSGMERIVSLLKGLGISDDRCEVI
jgi:hypothetical protein